MADTPMNKLRTHDVLRDLALVRTEIVDPVLSRLFVEGELERVRVARTGNGWAKVTIVACGESTRATIADDDQGEPVGDARAQFMSDVQDFIAESEFGWGQLRGPLYPEASDFD